MSTDTGIATTEKKKEEKTLRQVIEGDAFRFAISEILPKHVTSERMVRIACGALTRTPGLAKCTQSSVLMCLLQLSQWGLEPDGRRAHLVPFRDNKKNITVCTLILDYKGIAELVIRSGAVSTIHADLICPGDIFDYSMGELTSHVPHFLRTDDGKPKEAGPAIGAYCRVVMKDGTQVCRVMSKVEIETVKNNSPASKTSESPWNGKFWGEMWKKTVFKRTSKWLPWSADIRDMIDHDDRSESAEGAAATPKLTTTEFAGMLDAPEDETTTIEGDAEPSQEPEFALGKQPGDLAQSRRNIANATTKATIQKAYEAERDNFAWSEQDAFELDAFTTEHLGALKK